ncbi:MAG: hypothetical protein A4E53_01913 [Pelotomaculum sp. PtaB.Bin104]|nr:MAG: hypothetical protein A4E53_01913 [Pelotomaculum sp. PtaB.Bin104]
MKSLWYRFKRLKGNIFLLYYAIKDPRTPWQAKALVMLLAAYIISPVDVLPGLIFPGPGYLDDIILIPLGVEFILNMIPNPVLSEAKFKAINIRQNAKSWTVAVVGVTIIVLVLFFALSFLIM